MPFVPLSASSGVCVFILFGSFIDRVFLELKGGGKSAAWTRIKESNGWYIDKRFLLPGKPFYDPTRILDTAIHAYWSHWYKMAKSGDTFCFTTVQPCKKEVGGGGERQSEEESQPKKEGDDEDEDGSSNQDRSRREGTPEGSNGDQASHVLTPDQCESEGEKLSFIRSLCGEEVDYQAVIDLVAQMRVSYLHFWHTPSYKRYLNWQSCEGQVASWLLQMGLG